MEKECINYIDYIDYTKQTIVKEFFAFNEINLIEIIGETIEITVLSKSIAPDKIYIFRCSHVIKRVPHGFIVS